MTFRAAVIGCGRIGSSFADDPGLTGDVFSHAEAYARCPDTELVAVCDADRARAEQCANRWGLTHSFTDFQQLLKESAPDIVSVCTPDEVHYEIALGALGAPSVKAIMCEKPITTTIDEGLTLERVANETGKKVAVAYGRRYAANIGALQRWLAEGNLGPIRAVAGWYGKGVLHNGSHWFDLLRILGGNVEWVEAEDRVNDGESDATLDVSLGLRSGAVATVRGTDCRSYTVFEMDLMTERGRVEIRESGHRIKLFRAKESPRYTGYVELLPERHDFGDMRNVMLRAIGDLVAALVEDRDPLCTIEDGLAALRIAMAARTSAAAGKRRRIKLNDE